MALIATDQILKELCLEMDDPGFLRYNKLMGGLLAGIRDLSIFNLPTFSHVTLNLNAYNAVDWPCSLVKPLITCLLREGRCVILGVSDDITNTFPISAEITDIESADSAINNAFTIDGSWFWWNNAFNWGIGEMYGLKGGYNHLAYVTHDMQTRQTFIKGGCLRSTDQIVMFFKTDGLTDCPKFVPVETQTALEHYTLYKYYRNRNANLSELNLKNYKENFTRLTKYQGDSEISWIESMGSNISSAPKGF